MVTMAEDAEVVDGKREELSLEEMLKQASDEVAAFDAKKVRKTELEGFVTKAKAASTTYDAATYQQRRDTWKSQNERIERLHKALNSQYPGWKTGELLDCVCGNLNVLRDKRTALEGLLDRSISDEERARDKAEKARDDARKHMDALVGNDKKVEAWLKENDKKISDICREMEGPAPAGAIYSLWFDLLPRHRQLVAAADAHCLDYCKGETPEDLCRWTAPPSPQHAVPWIVAPDDYPGALQLAWAEFDKARQAFETASAAHAAFLRSITDTSKEIEAKEKSLEGDIKVCLNSKAPPKLCADKPAPDAAAPQSEARTTQAAEA